jgi:hypothetical protein
MSERLLIPMKRKRGSPKPLSRQRKWQKKQLDSGNCMICGDPRTLYATHCDACNEKVMAYQRSKTGFQPWKPGGRGRPPLKRAEVASAAI